MKRKTWKVILITAFLCSGHPWILRAESDYDIKQMTPGIQDAFKNRKARYEELQRFKTEGLIGEDREGFVKALRPSPEAEQLAGRENSDRGTIYQAIVDQNHLGPDGMGKVKTAFAEVQKEKTRPGDWFQRPSGEWVKKQG